MQDQRFPILTQNQLNILKNYGSVESFKERTQVFKIGEHQYDFFAILKGSVRIENPYNESLVVEHLQNEFTGDSGMLGNREAQFDAFTTENTTLLRIKSSQLKKAISQHSNISDTLLNAFLLREETVLNEFSGGIKLVGSGYDDKTYEIRNFLEKNHIWHSFIDINTATNASELLETFDIKKDQLPILVRANNEICSNPTIEQLAKYTGVLMEFGDQIFDLLIVGAGPSGLAASVYAASEGLKVVTIDNIAPGGQAGTSSKIENYLGFPSGISGHDLAKRAYIQAQKFGCNISIPHKAEKMDYNGDFFTVEASNQYAIKARSVIIATGARYRKLDLDNLHDYEGSGVYYSATGMNVAACHKELVGIVGGGNSAGQAALFLAQHADHVYIILRGDDLGSKMSDYLVQRIEAAENITVLLHSEVAKLHGSDHLEKVTINKQNELSEFNITNLFTFIGAKPCTEWLPNQVHVDENGFVETGLQVPDETLTTCEIYRKRKPQSLETNIPGLFAVGDVRKGSVKRVASAVGEGSMVVSQVHYFLSSIKE